MTLSGIVPWNKTVQPWHSQCKISDLIQIPVTSCDIPFGLTIEDKAISVSTGWLLPISFDQRLSFDTSTNTPRLAGGENISNLAYMVLGKIIEKITGLNYYEAVRRDILRLIGVSDVDMVEALGSAQLKDSGGVVMRGNGPGEVWPDSRQDDDSLDIRKSEYDGRTLVRGAHAARLENFQATGAWVGTTKARLTIGMYYNVNGVPFNTNPAFVGEVQNGEFTGTSSILKQSATSWAVYANFNRYENLSDGPPAYAASSRITNTILTNLNGASFTYDLAKVSSAATQQVCTYRNVYSKGVSRYFPADPVAIQLFDANPSYGWTRTGDCWNMWSVGAVGTQALWRYYCPSCISHVFVTTDDATTLQMTYPNAEGYNWAVRFDAKTLATKPLNATGGCDVGTIPIYRLFRSTNPNHLFTSRAEWNQKPPDADYKSEGAVFCGVS